MGACVFKSLQYFYSVIADTTHKSIQRHRLNQSSNTTGAGSAAGAGAATGVLTVSVCTVFDAIATTSCLIRSFNSVSSVFLFVSAETYSSGMGLVCTFTVVVTGTPFRYRRSSWFSRSTNFTIKKTLSICSASKSIFTS